MPPIFDLGGIKMTHYLFRKILNTRGPWATLLTSPTQLLHAIKKLQQKYQTIIYSIEKGVTLSLKKK